MRVIADSSVVGLACVPGALALPSGDTYSVEPVEPPPVSTSRKSTFGSPPELVGSNRTVLLPALRLTVSVLVTQVVQAPVPSNDADCTTEPLTSTLAARAVVVPLANRTPSVAVPAAGAFTVNW